MKTTLLSWGRYPHFPQTPHGVPWRSELPERFTRLRTLHKTTLAFGNGRSYGDSCLAASDQVLSMRRLDRFIAVDWERGLLQAEAGVTLAEILSLCVPHGWFLRVTPGTRFATLGGAIANDVHGKNHHRKGTFGCHVERFGLLRSGEGALVCSAQEHPELYAATIGGLGLTGIIEWAEIRLERIRSSRIDQVTQRFGSLAEFFALSEELDRVHEFSVAWIDCVAKGAATGRGVYMAGDFATRGGLQVETSRVLSVPVVPPVSLVNRLSLRVFNEAYWRKAPERRTLKPGGYAPFFYPLDGILHWNRIYGRRGFQQYQCVIPWDDAEAVMSALLQAIAVTGAGSFLAVLKRFGDAVSPGLLSFPRPGVTLALDFPNQRGLEEGLFRRLDAIVREANGRLFPAKDAHMSPADFRQGYPEWERLEALRDPALQSRFWRRVTR